MIKQRWECPRCGRIYESPVRLSAISCSKFGTCKAMTLIEGDSLAPPSSISKSAINSKTSKGK